MPTKRVLLLVIDALSARVVKPAIESGRLPAMAELAERGLMRDECLSVFPSITPAATASIVTGAYPAQSGIAGAYWYNPEREEVAYFGDDLWVALEEGASQFFNDFLVRLNGERLVVPTLYEMAEDAGLTAACLNYMWFRGRQTHTTQVPLLLRVIPGIDSSQQIQGPKTLSLGDFITTVDSTVSRRLPNEGGLLRRFGFDDNNSAEQLETLLTSKTPPDVCVAYFPENDFQSHRVGPDRALDTIRNVDKRLKDVFDACGGLTELLTRYAIIITGDHSQSYLVSDDSKMIHLEETLSDYNLAAAGEQWSADDDLMACPNLRAAQIYFHHDKAHLREPVINTLLAEPRIDQVFWLEAQHEGQPERIHVSTADRGRLWFQRKSADVGKTVTDHHGNAWSYSGDLDSLDAQIRHGDHLEFGDYPNACERVEGAFFGRSGSIWITARLGYEFALPRSSTHRVGSHGSLHKLDSIAPLIVAGLPDGVDVPQHARTIDIVPLCRKLLGIS